MSMRDEKSCPSNTESCRGSKAHQFDISVGRRLRQARINAGLTQTALGRELGLSFQSVQRYEQGATSIGAGRLLQAAAALDIVITFPFQDLIDFDNFPVVSGQGSERPPALSRDAYRAARMFDAIGDNETRSCLMVFLERLAAE